jgi:hypothetical protein
MMNQLPPTRRVISLFQATRPPARERVAEFVDLDEAFEALDVLTSKRGPTRADWLAAIRSPRERVASDRLGGA